MKEFFGMDGNNVGKRKVIILNDTEKIKVIGK